MGRLTYLGQHQRKWPGLISVFASGRSVVVQDECKIVVLNDSLSQLDGLVLSPVCQDAADPRRVADFLVQWHFRNAVVRNAVLADVKGAGEPQWDYELSPGNDMIRQIMAGPDAARRVEGELGTFPIDHQYKYVRRIDMVSKLDRHRSSELLSAEDAFK